MIKANPESPASELENGLLITTCMAVMSGRNTLEPLEISMVTHAFDRFKVTFDEAMDAVWKAYADPFVSNGKIEFRHLWKHIEKDREEKGERFNFVGIYKDPTL